MNTEIEQTIIQIANNVLVQFQGSSFRWTAIEVPLVRRHNNIDLAQTPIMIDDVLLKNGFVRMHGKPEFRNVFYTKIQ